jgi:hypothetical protein
MESKKAGAYSAVARGFACTERFAAPAGLVISKNFVFNMSLVLVQAGAAYMKGCV